MKKAIATVVILLATAGVSHSQILTSKATLDTSTQKEKTVTTMKVEGTVSLREDQTFTKVVAIMGTLIDGKFVGLDPEVKLDTKPELTNNEGKYEIHFKKMPQESGTYSVKVVIAYKGADGDDYTSQPSYVTVTVP